MCKDKSKPDPYRVFQAIADIISEREGVKITVKSVKRKDEAIGAKRNSPENSVLSSSDSRP